MSKYKSKHLVILAFLVVSSCSATQPSQPYQPVQALLVQPSADSRLILEKAIGDLFNSQPIKLADNVFTQKSTIIIDPLLAKDSRGNVLDGREIRQADTVSLLIKNGKCYVRLNQSGHVKLLVNISCRPLES